MNIILKVVMTKITTRKKKFDNAIYMFIDAYLIVHGEISRKVVCDTFGIASVKASQIFSAYSENRPSNMRYVCAKKRYIKGIVFTHDHLGSISALQYLDAVDLLYKPETINKNEI